jgi:hypothetical protein
MKNNEAGNTKYIIGLNLQASIKLNFNISIKALVNPQPGQ